MGHLVWDTPRYASEPRLEPLRSLYHSRCENRVGAAAAACLSDVFARAFPADSPQHELFDPVYDPARDLAAHMAGEPGHCVTRSGLISAVLLSVGIPARVVQFYGVMGAGHNVMAVWDGELGWAVFDPSFGAFVAVGQRPVGAEAIVAQPDDVGLLRAGLAPAGEKAQEFYHTLTAGGVTVTYPEPWLYLRVGERAAPWPLRASFAVIGARRWCVGPAQTAARASALAFTLVAVAAALVYLRGRGWRRRDDAFAQDPGLDPAE